MNTSDQYHFVNMIKFVPCPGQVIEIPQSFYFVTITIFHGKINYDQLQV